MVPGRSSLVIRNRLSSLLLQNRRMKWKKENKSKVEGGEGLDESPEPPSQ